MSESITNYDVIIIGGGPAGLSASFWCHELGLRSILFEKEAELGGQLLWTYNPITNYPGVEAANGSELRDRFLHHTANRHGRHILQDPVVASDLQAKSVETASGKEYCAKAIIIATGVRRRKLNIPGEDEFYGKGILESGAKDRNQVAGKTVLIVGGGDAALENALILGETAAKVYVVHRRGDLTARHEFISASKANPKIVFLTNTTLISIEGNKIVERVGIRRKRPVESKKLLVDAVLVRIGVQPNSEIFRDQVALDAAGYFITERNCATNIDGIFAIGDISSPLAPTIASSAGNGATVAKVIRDLLTPANARLIGHSALKHI